MEPMEFFDPFYGDSFRLLVGVFATFRENKSGTVSSLYQIGVNDHRLRGHANILQGYIQREWI